MGTCPLSLAQLAILDSLFFKREVGAHPVFPLRLTWVVQNLVLFPQGDSAPGYASQAIWHCPPLLQLDPVNQRFWEGSQKHFGDRCPVQDYPKDILKRQ